MLHMEVKEELSKLYTRRAKLLWHWLVLEVRFYVVSYNDNVLINPFMRRS